MNWFNSKKKENSPEHSSENSPNDTPSQSFHSKKFYQESSLQCQTDPDDN